MLISPTINSVHGRIRSITGTDPAADTEISETVPERRRWRLLGFNFSLVTDVTVANRTVTVSINDGSSELYKYALTATQAASLTYKYFFFPTPTPELQIGSYIYLPIPPLLLGPGYIIKTITVQLKAGDDYFAPQLLVEEWIDP